VLGATPANAQAFEGQADGLAAELPRRPGTDVADLGDALEGPQAAGLGEQARASMQQFLQRFGEGGIEEGAGGVRPGGLLLQAGQPLAAEGMDGVADGGTGAAEAAGDVRRSLAIGAGEQDLTATQGEGIGATKSLLQLLPLGECQRRNEEA
jgi:hypothetical protein